MLTFLTSQSIVAANHSSLYPSCKPENEINNVVVNPPNKTSLTKDTVNNKESELILKYVKQVPLSHFNNYAKHIEFIYLQTSQFKLTKGKASHLHDLQ